MASKRDVLDAALVAIQKKFGKDSAQRLGGEDSAGSEVREVIPTGLSVLDHYLFAVGGLPVGRITELAGEEAAGKTALALALLGAAQRAGARAALIDAELAYNSERAKTFGVDETQLLITPPACAEDGIETIKMLVAANDPSKAPMLIVYDSLVAAPPRKAFGMEAGDVAIGELARLMSQELPKLVAQLQEKRVHLLIVNQVREKIGVMFGDNKTTPGGRALKFYASTRLMMLGGKAVKHAKTGEHVGKVVTVLCVKTRFSPPWRKGRVLLRYATGWDEEWSTLEHAKTAGVVAGRGPGGAAVRGAKAYAVAIEKLGWPQQELKPVDAVQGDDGGDDDDDVEDAT